MDTNKPTPHGRRDGDGRHLTDAKEIGSAKHLRQATGAAKDRICAVKPDRRNAAD